MIKNFNIRTLAIPFGALFFALLIMSSSSQASAIENFRAVLSGDEEVLPVATMGRGNAHFQLNKDGTELSFRLIVANIESVTQAHIHLAPAGTNGSPVAFLFDFVPEGVTVNGNLVMGTLTEVDLIGPLVGLLLSDLVAAMAAGNTYVNVHTQANPPGEIRGQIF